MRDSAVLNDPVTVEIEWEITMRPSRLKPCYEGQEFVQELVPLSKEEKKDFTHCTPEIDYHEKTFHEWMSTKSLFVGIFG